MSEKKIIDVRFFLRRWFDHRCSSSNDNCVSVSIKKRVFKRAIDQAKERDR